ncbi:1-deoxy-D-xylulose 5-phosphate reductoisomerase [Candidatus Arcanobacter lacustris]|uniref:1-deoxy-D-xylulose 5-phosphate reductoisomerase n=1 Tax=Candidatus Arcanibacter lacustris TaxID=1607817 RepID=A0A0F5MNC1_9RICK|nr:1-deoxy-D-xylulose 5-phosphate reductoisomerase [Candidatus Arcanobacter lacustris]KKB96080.1 1-deoxy-D-xylulose 5-phosphate reductoisomerase [Candidatus Arcanobacter lacustris]
MIKTLSILGSTGTIGRNTLDIIAQEKDRFKIIALTANNNIELLCSQALEFDAKIIAFEDESLYPRAQELLSGSKIKIFTGKNSLVDAAGEKTDITMSAIVGMAGLKPTMGAINAGCNIALANKESLVCAGDLMLDAASKNNVKIIPVDSEHNAIFQIFDFDNPHYVDKIILTASGGPFLDLPLDQLSSVTISQALNHPRWKMGSKISIDSATMMNKVLEIIEAYYLFKIDIEKITPIIHPESIVHSMVSYIDGSTLAQMGIADMRIPIDFALNYPVRKSNNLAKLNLSQIAKLTFLEPDLAKFPSLKLVTNVVKLGLGAQIIMNGANEVAVDRFLKGKIKFTDIVDIVARTLDKFSTENPKNIEQILEIDEKARVFATHITKT